MSTFAQDPPDKPHYPWVSLVDSVLAEYEENALGHDAKAAEHEAQGHPPEYAAGSRRKALKWRLRAAELRARATPSWVGTLMQPLFEAMMGRFERKIDDAHMRNGEDTTL